MGMMWGRRVKKESGGRGSGDRKSSVDRQLTTVYDGRPVMIGDSNVSKSY